MTTTPTTQKRQTCSVCFQSTTDYTTRVHDRRTQWEILAGREPQRAVFHACRSCLPHGRDQIQLVCPTCDGKGSVRASWNETYHCQTCTGSGKVWVNVDDCTGERYPINPDAPEEGTDIRHSQSCPVHPDAEVAR